MHAERRGQNGFMQEIHGTKNRRDFIPIEVVGGFVGIELTALPALIVISDSLDSGKSPQEVVKGYSEKARSFVSRVVGKRLHKSTAFPEDTDQARPLE